LALDPLEPRCAPRPIPACRRSLTTRRSRVGV